MSAQHTPVFAFACSVVGAPWGPTTVNHSSAGKAKADYWRDIRDARPDVPFTAIRVRKLGPPHTSEAFKRTAAYRGLPDLKCGDPVEVNGRSGVIVGHNDSANFDVLFSEGDWAGAVLNCHPGDFDKATGSAA